MFAIKIGSTRNTQQMAGEYQPSMFLKGLRWLNAAALAGLGGYSFVVSLQYFSDPTRCVLCIYLTLFGLLLMACEAKLGFASRNFGFLMNDQGLSGFLIFIGTLGLSFGWFDTPIQKIIPFLLGILSCVVAVVMIVEKWCRGSKGSSGTELDGRNANAGPNAI